MKTISIQPAFKTTSAVDLWPNAMRVLVAEKCPFGGKNPGTTRWPGYILYPGTQHELIHYWNHQSKTCKLPTNYLYIMITANLFFVKIKHSNQSYNFPISIISLQLKWFPMSADPTSSDVLGLKNSLARPKPKPAANTGRSSLENAASLDNTSLPANQPY